jgi:hypothetical protein
VVHPWNPCDLATASWRSGAGKRSQIYSGQKGDQMDRHTEALKQEATGFLMFCNMVLPGVVPLGGGSYCTEKVLLPLIKQQLGAV